MNAVKKNDLRQYRTYGMPLMLFLALLAVAGIVATVLLKTFVG